MRLFWNLQVNDIAVFTQEVWKYIGYIELNLLNVE